MQKEYDIDKLNPRKNPHSALIRSEIDFSDPLTEAQVKMLEAMDAQPAAPDDDCPEYSEAELLYMMKLAADRQLQEAEAEESETDVRYTSEDVQKAMMDAIRCD